MKLDAFLKDTFKGDKAYPTKRKSNGMNFCTCPSTMKSITLTR